MLHDRAPSLRRRRGRNAKQRLSLARAREPVRFLRSVCRVPLHRRASRAGGDLRADRGSKPPRAGIEFADHRDYAAGRRSALRRLEDLRAARTSRAAALPGGRGRSIDVLVDASASMAMATAEVDWRAALAYVGLSNDWVAVTAVLGAQAGPPPGRGKAPHPADPPLSRRRSGAAAGTFADFEAIAGGSRPRVPLAAGWPEARGGGLVSLDFYDPAGARAALELVRRSPRGGCAGRAPARRAPPPGRRNRRRAPPPRASGHPAATGTRGRLPPATMASKSATVPAAAPERRRDNGGSAGCGPCRAPGGGPAAPAPSAVTATRSRLERPT